VTPSSLAFGAQPVGTSAQPQTVTVTNTGSGDLHVSAMSIAGANPGDFTVASDACSGRTVSPHAACAAGVQFSPTAAGARWATLVVTDDAGAGQRVGLSGTATQPAISVNPDPVDFGGVATKKYWYYDVTVTNTGTADLHISSISIGGPDSGSFAGQWMCSSTTLAPQGQCTVRLYFYADYAGQYQAALVFGDDAAGGTQSVGVTATAVSGD